MKDFINNASNSISQILDNSKCNIPTFEISLLWISITNPLYPNGSSKALNNVSKVSSYVSINLASIRIDPQN